MSVSSNARGVDDVAAVKPGDVSEFLMQLREGDADHQPLGSGSAARTIVAVRGFHKFVVREGLSDADPAGGGQASGAAEAASEGIAVGRCGEDPRGRRCCRHGARHARSRVAGGALRHRRADLGGSRSRRRRSGPRARHRVAQRQGRQATRRARRLVCSRGRQCLPRARSPGTRRGESPAPRCFSTPAAAGCRASLLGRC